MKGIAGNLIFTLIICQSLQLCVTNENTVFDNLNYNADEVQWVEAVNRCNENGATLVPFQPEPGSNGKNVTVVKRSVHFKIGNESWVGDYKTYDVIKGSEINLDIHVHKCVALHVTDESVLKNNNRVYGYDLVIKNCTSNLPAICSNDNNMFIKDENTLTEWFDNRGCNLWEPKYKIKPVAEDTSFGSGHFTSSQVNQNLIGKFYWVNYIVQEQYSKLPIAGNILQCGYINHTSTGVSYTDCSIKKPFICQIDENESLSSSSSTSKGLYIGLAGAMLFVVAVIVGVVFFILRIRRKQFTKSSEDLPRGGKSFTKRKEAEELDENDGRDNAAFKENNRITTYHQINIDQIKLKPPDNKESFASGNRDSGHTYSMVQKKKKNDNKPDVVPRTSTRKSVERPGYLSMDGTNTKQNADGADKEYDFLESTRSTNSSRYRQIDRNATDGNIYSTTSSDVNDSTYDVTFHRGSSQKRLINEEYDRVIVESGSMTMNRGNCESIGEQYSSTNITSSPVINPCYDRVVIK